MRKLYSIVLMATALLIGTNVWAKTHVAQIVGGGTYETLEAAFAAATNGQTIEMLDNDTLTKPIDFGKATKESEYNPKTVTLDFKGKTVTMEGTTKKVNGVNVKQDRMFNVYSGALKLVNSTPAAGGGLHHTYNSGKYYTILVFGSIRKDCDPSEDKEDKLGYYTYLSIGDGVNIVSDGENNDKGGICVMIMPNGTNSVTQDKKSCAITATTAPQVGGAEALAGSNIWNGYNTCGSYIYTNDYKFDDTKACGKKYSFSDPRGVANGVRIDVYGHLEGSLYAMQSNGQLAGPDDKYKEADSYYNTYKNTFYGGKIPAEVADISDNDKNYAPYIHIYDGAQLTNKEGVNENLKPKQVALYTSGYARWYVEGECSGTTGLYMKSGDVTLKNATISSSFEGTATNNSGQTIGVSGQGNAVVVESNDHYSGHISLNIEGDTKVTTPADDGTALLETVSKNSDPAVEHININGGTLTGENAIVISQETAEENVVAVYGSTMEGAVDADLDKILPSSVHTTTTVQDGKTTVVVSKGNGPEVSGNWATVSAPAATGKNVKWTALEADAAINSGKVSLGELQIVSGNALGDQKLTIANGATLEVTRLIMNDYAQIVVEAGGTLIVTGEQGINAPSVDNIILKTSKDAQAIFLLRPHVTSNRHPSATVQLQTYSWYESNTSYQWQRFGVPTFGAVSSFECVENAVNTQIQAFDNGNWVSLGYIGKTPAVKPADLNKPFVTYNLIANRVQSAAAPIYNIKGQLVGNENASLNAYSEWNLFSNSYLAKVDVKAFLGDLAGVDQVVYIATPAGVGTYTWDARDLEWAAGVKLNPMAAFILHNPGEAAISAINYEKAVYEPATKGSSPAPRRFAQTSDKTAKLRLIVANEEGVQDDVKMTEKTSNLHNAAKYMNDDLNIYAMADEKAAIVAAEDLENTYVGFSTVRGGNFTISFANVEGREFTLVDHATGARVEIAEGNTYEFTADANSANDYRFEIVGRANMPTAIDNTEAVKSVKGVYTITGQYVGEMNVWNTLPAGVYVVNGEKRVK